MYVCVCVHACVCVRMCMCACVCVHYIHVLVHLAMRILSCVCSLLLSPFFMHICILIGVSSGLACGIYSTNNPEACKFIAEDCKVSIAVVEDQKQLDKFLKVRKCCVLFCNMEMPFDIHTYMYM